MSTFFMIWYWLHWALDVLFFVACVSVIFRPHLIARMYVAFFLGQQLVLNGCLMTQLQNYFAARAGWSTSPNRFIMAEVLHGPIVNVYKLLFLIIVAWQLYYIVKEISQWKIFQRFTLRKVTYS